jgi:DNA-binding CsgD family transcriptional regulator
MADLTAEDWEKIDEAILLLNAESDLRRLRKQVLLCIDKIIPYKRAFFDLGETKNRKAIFFDPVGNKMEDKYLDLYSKYESVDPMYFFFLQQKNDVYRESDFVSDTMHEATDYYSDWLVPQDIYNALGAAILYNGILYGSINIWRSRNDKDFSDHEMKIMSVLSRHIALRFWQLFPGGVKEGGLSEPSAEALREAYGLSSREADVAACIREGCTTRGIAEKLCITEDTVKKHTTHIFRKTGATNRTELARLILKL